MQPVTSFTEGQLAEFRRVFIVRRRLRRLVGSTSLTLLLAIVVLRLQGVEEVFGVPADRWRVYLLAYVGLTVLVSLANWRCPACRRFLGRTGNPRFCVRCGAPLQ